MAKNKTSEVRKWENRWVFSCRTENGGIGYLMGNATQDQHEASGAVVQFTDDAEEAIYSMDGDSHLSGWPWLMKQHHLKCERLEVISHKLCDKPDWDGKLDSTETTTIGGNDEVSQFTREEVARMVDENTEDGDIDECGGL